MDTVVVKYVFTHIQKWLKRIVLAVVDTISFVDELSNLDIHPWLVRQG
ncbi:hypothetical protein BTN49_1015 [Candidatus Enterovibrio escicola]|uniref:Uncharacterized protein n=1 Tax=Candidatus Enterovibrio escicola TaxID=1927127 RepID=A0A2A5T4J4_9GAMM|nr:hypothetical protein BTN49_1015 [Candidatus Enterovibrio escacola]